MKLWTIVRALRFRQEHPSLFQAGSYLGLATEGEKREHVVAFARTWRDQAAIVAVPRLCFLLTSGEMLPPLSEVWQNTVVQLPKSGTYWNVLTDEMIDLAGSRSLSCKKLFACFPGALLVSR